MLDSLRHFFGRSQGKEIGYQDIHGPSCFTAICSICNYPMMAILFDGIPPGARYIRCGNCHKASAFDDPNLFLEMNFFQQSND